MGPDAGSDHGSPGKAPRPAPLTGGYFWFSTPGEPTIAWEVVTCHQLGFDAEEGHVEMWTSVVERLTCAWGKDATLVRPRLRECCYGLPRGRVTRPEKRFLILHGEDSPCQDWLDRVLVAFGLERRSVRVLFDEHERTMVEDRKRVMETLCPTAC